ncbi:SlyX family protein [Oceanisphaera pacifica]|uniref:Protein SlyX homolog n=1 Tax=Oceanisphaera pacifica TaxID=2818389 RepID=A0ABS3ND11_9GAMM|nr:SlyX family protein [Oceanisphaera pacifica]MBO1518367.1 SlyX family protein [Oceanisphaera pacifica]
MNNDILNRLEQLETRLAFQDDTIEQLNQEITTQGYETARLKEQLNLMVNKLKDLQHNQADNSGEDPPPPHY